MPRPQRAQGEEGLLPLLLIKMSETNLKWENWDLDLGTGLHRDVRPPPASTALLAG